MKIAPQSSILALAAAFSCVFLPFKLVHAYDASDSSMKQLSFFGRWDLRSTERAVTVNSGSYILAHFFGDSVSAQFDVSLNQTPKPTLAWKIDDGKWQEAEVQSSVDLGRDLGNRPHALWLMVRALDEHQNRWTKPLTASITFLGLTLSASGQILAPLAEWTHPKLKVEFLGDSITEGVLVQPGECGPGKTTWPWQSDALHSYSCQTAMLLGASWRQVGFGATGLDHGGSGNAVSALNSFNFFYNDCPRDDWQPDLVVINQGTNNSGTPPDTYLPLYSKYLDMIRQAYPQAKIAALRPFGGFQADSIKAAVDRARANGDTHIYFIDTTGWYSGDLHPNAKSCADIGQRLAAALKSQVLQSF